MVSKIKRIIYISHGNIPSKWAHTVQTMKMAEALGQIVPDFELVTQIHWRDLWKRRFDFESWYGISKPFRIRRLATCCAPRRKVFEHVFSEGFAETAVNWVQKRIPDLVFTRCHFAAQKLADRSIPFIYETHATKDRELEARLVPISRSPSLKAVVTISDSLKQKYAACGVPENRILVLPDAVDLERWQAAPNQIDARRQLGLNPSGFYAMYCGHLYDHRGIEEILHAARILSNVNFVLVGGWEKDVQRRKEEAAGLSNVTFTGFVPNALVPVYAAASNCILIPYSAKVPRVECMSPLKLFESMATGRPIIACDLSAIRQHLQHQFNALLIPPDCGNSLVLSIKKLLYNEVDGKILATQALHDVSPYTWTSRAEKILSFIQVSSNNIVNENSSCLSPLA